MENRFQQLLEVAFPASADFDVFRGVSRGIVLGDGLIENTPWLKEGGGHDLRGFARRHGIMFSVRDLCIKGDLPFSAEIVAMPHGPWHWLEIRSANFVAHICRTPGPYLFPDEALSRQDERLRNQLGLFDEKVRDLGELVPKIREFYAWLTYGALASEGLQHLCWAMPPADESDWLAHRNIYRADREIIPEPPLPSSAPDKPSEAIKLRFKEEIEKALNDNKKDPSEY
jgi:hypothetical protein